MLIRFIFVISISCLTLVVSTSSDVVAQSSVSEGVNWKKTLRLRGLMGRFDPMNETNLYSLNDAEKQENLGIQKDYVQMELVSSTFWMVLRDSLQQAIKAGMVDAYTLGRNPIISQYNIRTKGTKVIYQDLLDSLDLNYKKLMEQGVPPDIINPSGATADDRLLPLDDRFLIQPDANGRIVKDFSLLGSYELEITIEVDETGFKITPTALIIGTAHMESGTPFPEDQWMDFYFSGYDNDGITAATPPDAWKSTGFYLDLTEMKTIKFLVEHGVQYSGEMNIIPFYDLLTMFHYDYKIYSESNNVLAEVANQFNKYNLRELSSTVLNRYNDLKFTYLYGQAPEWWEQGKKGALTNGMYEVEQVVEQAPQNGGQEEDQNN